MKRAIKDVSNYSQSSLKVDLNKSSNGCTPCFNEALEISKKVDARSPNEIKIEEIKDIVNSIFLNKNIK